MGGGILHSIEKATQLVHGTPRLAASHRTFPFFSTGQSLALVLERMGRFCTDLSRMACLRSGVEYNISRRPRCRVCDDSMAKSLLAPGKTVKTAHTKRYIPHKLWMHAAWIELLN